MKKQAWLTQGLPLLVAAAAPAGAVGTQTLSSRNRTQTPMVVPHQPQDHSQQQLDLTSFGAFTFEELTGVAAEAPIKVMANPEVALRRLPSHRLDKLLQKNSQSGVSDKLFSGVQSVGGTDELVRSVGVCSSHTCLTINLNFCNTPSDCGGIAQTITFNNPGAKSFGTTPTLIATASSGLTVTFSSATTSVCTITGGGLTTFVTTGTCTIRANQAGNGTYSAAPQVQQSFTVNAVVPGAPTIGTATAGNTQTSVTFSAPGSNGGAAITGYTVTSNPGGITGTGAGSPITVTGLTNGTAYTFSVTATNSAGTGSASAASNSVTPIGPQTITFTNPGAQNFGTSPTLTATATSSLTPTFTSSTTSVCTITSGGLLTFVTAGTCTINADQAGNSAYSAATQVSRSFTVNAIVPGAPTVGTATAGDSQASVTFSAPGSSGGASITGYTVTASPGGATGTGASSPITVTGLTNGTAYTFTVTATNSAGTGSASAASNSATPIGLQTITFANPGAQNFGTSPTLTATATSSLTPVFTSSTTAVCTVTSGGLLTFVTAGTCTINSDQAGNGSYQAASTVTRSFTVNAIVPGAPTVGAATAGDTQASVAFTAPASSGGAAITGYTVTANPGGATGTGASSPITVTGLTNGISYTFTVTATNSAGTGSASAASNSVTPAANQTITFANPGAQNFGTTPTLTATADSGLTPAFTSSTTAVCTITSGGALTFVSTGTCTINADQTGNSSYLAASQVSRSFTVNAVVPGAPTIGVASVGDTQASVAFTAPAFTGGASITGYTVTSNPGGLTGTGASSPIVVTGLTNGTAYTFTVTATNSAGTGSVSAASNSVTPGAIQTLTFANPGTQNLGSSPTLTATASSGLTPVFSSSTLGVCTITGGGALTLLSTGTCTITVNQSGNSNYFAAAPVVRSFTVAPAPNTAPSINGPSSVTMSEDGAPTPFALNLTGVDGENDTLTWSIQTPAQHGSASVSGTGNSKAISYVPVANYHGSDSFVVQVSDGSLTGSAQINVTVTSVNDTPVINGTPIFSVDQDIAYSFIPVASDIEGDALTFSIANKPSWASFNTATGALTGTPVFADVGITSGIVISVNDGTATKSLSAFALEVVMTIDPKQPLLSAPANLNINATGLYTPVTLAQLLGLATTASQAEIDTALQGLAHDSLKSDACCTTSAAGLDANKTMLLPPGRHEVVWTATSTGGLSATEHQVVNVNPLVSFSKSQIAIRGTQAQARVILNGPAPVYPLDIPFAIDSATSASANEYSLTDMVAHFTQAGQVEALVPVLLHNLSGLSDSQLVLRLSDPGTNTGITNTHVINIRQGNVAPTVTLHLSQGGINASLIVPGGGPVTATAEVTDPNIGDTHTFDWSASETALVDTDGDPANATRVFDPTGLTGAHQLQVTVTDSASTSGSTQLNFVTVSALPVLNAATDTDKDGLNDVIEGVGDANDNGIPNYLDNMPNSNILPQTVKVTDSYLLECDPGLVCGLGQFALSGISGGVQIQKDELVTIKGLTTDKQFDPVGGIFDFAVRDLPTPGQSVRIVIPQQAAIPAKAVYRKFHKGAWVSFVENATNSVHSSAGKPGYCPPPGAADWQAGLVEGYFCVQLTIEDGGPNDDDTAVNAAIVDPGVVSTPLPVVVQPPVEPPQPPATGHKKGGAINGLWLLLLSGLLFLRRKIK